MVFVYGVAIFVGVVAGFLVSWVERRWALKELISLEKNEQIVLSALRPRHLIGRTLSVSMLLALVFFLIVYEQHQNVIVFAYAVLACVLCAVILTDLDTSTIPNFLILACFLIWIVSVWFVDPSKGIYSGEFSFKLFFEEGPLSVFFDGLLAALVFGGGLFVFSAVYEQISKRPSLGGGDIKLVFVVSLFLGVTGSLFTMFLSAIFGLLFAPLWYRFGHLISLSKRNDLKDFGQKKVKAFPFGPAIALASLFSLVVMPLLL